jgi:predicted peroxiredoxin
MKKEIDRVKSLYRPVVDLDNKGKIIPPNFEIADKELENLVALAFKEGVKKQVDKY